jgi:hypothetical protein
MQTLPLRHSQGLGIYDKVGERVDVSWPNGRRIQYYSKVFIYKKRIKPKNKGRVGRAVVLDAWSTK